MRKRMGGMLLAAGVGVLGVWGSFNQAERVEQTVSEAAAALASSSMQGIETFVKGRDIHVTGVVDDVAERDGVLAAMNGIEGRRVVVDDLTIIPVASPFTFERIKTPNGSDYSGFVPSEIVRAKLVPTLGRGAADLTLSSGEPENWVEAVIAGDAGLELLKSGTLSMSDKTVTLTGVAANPANEAEALAAITLPDGYTLSTDIDVEDDGEPFELTVDFDGYKTTIEGKLPLGSDIANMASGRGLRTVTSDVSIARIEDADGLWPDIVKTALGALGRLSEGRLEMEGKQMAITGVGTPSGKADAESLIGALPASLDVTVDIKIYDDGQPIVVRASKQKGAGIVATKGKLPIDYNISVARITDPEVLRTGFLPDETGNFDRNLRAASGALLRLQEGTLEASGEAVQIKGVASTVAIADNVKAVLEERVRGDLIVDITVFDDGKSFALLATKAEDGSVLATSGKMPFGLTEESFGLAPAPGVAQATIKDDSGAFDPNVKAALAALKSLQSGSIDVTPEWVKITGVVVSPTEETEVYAALNALPDAMERKIDLTVLDDGSLPAYLIDFKAAEGIEIEGKLPAGMTSADIGAMMGIPVTLDKSRTGLAGNGSQAQELIAEFTRWLPELEKGTLRVDGDKVAVEGVISPGGDLGLVSEGMAAGMDARTEIRLSEMKVLPTRGTLRTNVVTKIEERFLNVAWIPVTEFQPAVQTCTAQTNAALKQNKLNFVTGSSRLDAQSARTVNLVGSIVRRCILDGGLKAEIQGHTDAQGSNAANQRLSQSRADSVVAALIQRGVPAAGLTAVGYGETQPIADNTTAVGRGQNRRTTIVWSE